MKKWGLSACTMTISKKSLQFFPTMCIIPLSLWTEEKKICITHCNTTDESHCGSEWIEISDTYTKLKGLFVMRNSFFPLLTNWCKTASVSSPLRINLSMKKGRKSWCNSKFIACAAICWINRVIRNWFLTQILHDPFVHVAFEMNHTDCFLGIKKKR